MGLDVLTGDVVEKRVVTLPDERDEDVVFVADPWILAAEILVRRGRDRADREGVGE